MAINDIVQTIAEARVDARSLSEFVFKPAGFKVARRLAPTVDTLQFYINRFNSLNGDFSSSVSVALSSLNNSVAEADGKVTYIETTVQDAINNTAIEGGVLADTFVTVENKLNQRQLNRGLPTIASMLSIVTPSTGMKVTVNSYHAGLNIGGGEFIYDAAKALVNDGGVVINGWVRQFVGMVQPEWWGAIPDGVASCLLPMQKAIDYCKANSARTYHPYGGGANGIWLNKGVYKIDGQLDLKRISGFRFASASAQTAVLFYSLKTGYMFDLQAYHFIGFDRVSLVTGTIDKSTEFDLITPDDVKQATLFNLSGVNGARHLWIDEANIEGFNTVFRSRDDRINVDKTSVRRTNIHYCDTIWDNDNYNAVSWTFEECSFFDYEVAFINPGNNLRVLNGLSMGGTFWKGDTLTNVLNRNMTFKDIRFESHLQFKPDGKPMWLDVTGRSVGVVFENCSMFAEPIDGSMATLVTGRMNATDYQDIKFVNCDLHGIFELTSSYNERGVTPRLTIENCPVSPSFDMKYTSGSANKKMNLILRNFWTSKLSRVNRFFLSQRDTGSTIEAGKSLANANERMIDTFSIIYGDSSEQPVVRTFPVFTVAPFTLLLAEITISYSNVGAGVVTFNFYADDSKSVLIATKEVVRQVGVARIAADDMLDTAEFSSTSKPLYLEIECTTEVGLTTNDISFEYVVKSTQD